jgi:NCS1 family nucleobase:cation symporter-1
MISQGYCVLTGMLPVYIGSSFVVNMLTAVFGSHYTSIPNHIPESIGFTTQQMLAFLLYWLVHIPFTLLRPNQLSWVFTLKMCTIPPAYIGLFIFCMVNTKGQLGGGLPSAQKASKSEFSWFIMYAINAGIGNTANSITNQPDYARWSSDHWAVIIPQLIANPISVTISSTFGILATSAINNVWGLELWNQWDLLAEIMNRYPRSDVRFAVFLCAAAQALLVLGTNIAANMIPFGSDSSMLWPRYINMTRGQFLGLCLAWAVNPWKILHSATTFTNFLSGYGLFMAAVVGPTCVDYYLITKGNMWITHLYDGSRSNPHYFYTRGWNINAYIAYIAGIALPFAGFIGTLGVNVSTAAIDLGHIGWLLSFFVSAFAYYVCCLIWPTPSQRAVREQGLKYEELSHQETYISPIILEGISEADETDAVEKGQKVTETAPDSPVTELRSEQGTM